MSQPPPWEPQPSAPQGWPPPPGSGWAPQSRFDPNDPLISDDYQGWFRRTTALIRRGWRPLALLQLVFVVPLLAIQTPAQIYSDQRQRASASRLAEPGAALDLGGLVGPLLVILVASVLAGAVYAFAVLASMRMVAVLAVGGRPTIGDALGAAVRRLPSMIGWYVVGGIISLGALIACFLPVIYVGAVLALLPAVVMFERGNAISRCFRLFHADLGAAVARVATLAGAAMVGGTVLATVTLIVGLVVQGSAAFDTTASVSDGSILVVGLVKGALNAAYYVVAGMVAVPFLVTTYADLRARYEPFTGASLAENGRDGRDGEAGPAGMTRPPA